MVLDIATAVRHRPELRFVVAGEGPEREKLQRRITGERLQVSLLGRIDDLSSLLGAADVALLTSTWEARALVAQEALLAGVPLVSTRVGGIESSSIRRLCWCPSAMPTRRLGRFSRWPATSM